MDLFITCIATGNEPIFKHFAGQYEKTKQTHIRSLGGKKKKTKSNGRMKRIVYTYHSLHDLLYI